MPAEEAALDSACALFGVPLRPEWRDDALAHLQAILAAARLVAEFPLDDEAEYAPVFTP